MAAQIWNGLQYSGVCPYQQGRSHHQEQHTAGNFCCSSEDGPQRITGPLTTQACLLKEGNIFASL